MPGKGAVHAGDRAPDKTQRLLSRAVWDTFAAMGVVRRFAVAGLDEAARKAGRVMGLPEDLVFRTKGQLAIDILTEALADGLPALLAFPHLHDLLFQHGIRRHEGL